MKQTVFLRPMRELSPNFWKLNFAIFFFTISYNLVIPEMNDFLTELGRADLKGLLIGLFTISSGLVRPFSGKLADTIGRKNVMLVGIVVSLLASLLYPFAFAAWFLLVIRFFHGFSAGFFPTGATALVTDIIPEDNRGMAMGIFGTFVSVGMGVGQGISSIIVQFGARDYVFYTAALFSILAYIFYFRVKETLNEKLAFSFSLLRLDKNEYFEIKVLPVFFVMFLTTVGSGIILVLSSDFSEYLHIKNKGAFFILYVLSTIFVRFFTGKLSDKYGRREVLLVGVVLLTLSTYCISFSTNATWYFASSACIGIAVGLTSPTLFAWTADLSPQERRGLGSSTMYIALEFGILFGALLTNVLYENTFNSLLFTFKVGTMITSVAAMYLIWHLLTQKSKH